jgi:Protein of unknown function (DUF2778)
VGKAAFVAVSLAFAAGFAAWIADVDVIDWLQGPALAKGTADVSFDDRFATGSTQDTVSIYYPSRRGVGGGRGNFDAEFAHIEGSLAEQSRDQQPDQPDEPVQSNPAPAPSAVAAIPLPRSRPADANLQARNDPPPGPVAEADKRTIFQKIADLMPGRIRLASLEPNGGILPGTGPDLTTLGYDNTTAVYDITARTVYMPDGTKLEAHSGLGERMDDPAHVRERMVGATPPGIYEMKPREQLFHGVAALRIIPVEGSNTLGRSGLLAHPYMLGPNGDSNGCVSIKDYDRFLKAFRNGEIKRLVVVTSLNNRQAVSSRSPSQS